MTLKFNRVWRLSRYMFVRNFIKLSAAVHELSCPQRNKKNSDENETARRYRAYSNNTKFVALSLRQSSGGQLTTRWMKTSSKRCHAATDLQTKPTGFRRPSSPTTQVADWDSFCCLTEDRRLSLRGWAVSYRGIQELSDAGNVPAINSPNEYSSPIDEWRKNIMCKHTFTFNAFKQV